MSSITPNLPTFERVLPNVQQYIHDTSEKLLYISKILSNDLDADQFITFAKKYYPEVGFYNGEVAGIPDGSALLGSEAEQKRTELSLKCLFWLIRGEYALFTQSQNENVKLLPNNFEFLSQLVKSLLPTLGSFDAMITTMAIHDLGKVVWIKQAVEKHAGRAFADHDQVLLYALEHMPELVPSYKQLDPSWQKMIRESWAMDFSSGQATQAENLPWNFSLICEAAEKNVDLINFYFVRELLDVSGALGHINGPVVLTEPVLGSYLTVRNALLVGSKDLEPKLVYDAILKSRGEKLELENVMDPEIRAVIRLCCMSRFFTKEEGQRALSAFRSLPLDVRETLLEELNISGLDDKQGILLYYAPQTLINALKGKTDDEKTIALCNTFQLFARLYRETRQLLGESNYNGVYTLNIAEVAKEVLVDSALINKQFKIDLNKNAVVAIEDKAAL